ncbi:MAG: acylneuraminate cytidylyltransferase family protein [Sulfuritalea sp.]|nr:acylneuraminate cytidylyltransferase family protein [Sulfuritalea sp.]
MRSIGFIFARGGSKGVPGKNIKALAGRPLIAYAIETALACRRLETVIVSTDDEEIASVARRYGAETPFMRPAELASDTAPEWLAWRHAILEVERERGPFDVFVSMPATSPFREVSDIEACIDALTGDFGADAVISVKEAARNPYFNMVRLDESGYAQRAMDSGAKIVRRQDVPPIFDVTTVAYAARPSYVLRAERLLEGKVRTVLVPDERAWDIDTPFDFMVADCIARAKSNRDSC